MLFSLSQSRNVNYFFLLFLATKGIFRKKTISKGMVEYEYCMSMWVYWEFAAVVPCGRRGSGTVAAAHEEKSPCVGATEERGRECVGDRCSIEVCDAGQIPCVKARSHTGRFGVSADVEGRSRRPSRCVSSWAFVVV